MLAYERSGYMSITRNARALPNHGVYFSSTLVVKQQSLAFSINGFYRGAMASERAQIAVLKRLIGEADLILETTPSLPENRTARCRELLRTALVLADDLLKQVKMPAAAQLGHKGGSTTSRRHGPEHYRQMAAARKTRAGGRPRKDSN
jgi:hypothetical protein